MYVFMLSILRRHVGWGLKVLLGVVIISFVFFFGYTAIREQTSDTIALKAGKEEIPFSKYQFFYENQYERIRATFKEGEIPEFLLKNMEQTIQGQLVRRSLTKQFAASLGLKVSDTELAEAIMQDKHFDPVAYKNFLEAFYRENGFSYEELVREDILIQKFQEWAQGLEPLAQVTKEKDVEKLDQPYLPRTRLLDLWYQDFAAKTKVQSFIRSNQEP